MFGGRRVARRTSRRTASNWSCRCQGALVRLRVLLKGAGQPLGQFAQFAYLAGQVERPPAGHCPARDRSWATARAAQAEVFVFVSAA